jgi:diguanylate cyclase (GGDEF)-like protein/PAS domain S-box-containing protein
VSGDAQLDPYEALTEFLYLVPVGLMQFHQSGAVQLVNPLAAQFLMPLTPAGDMSDAYCALAPLVPDLARLVRDFSQPTGVIIDHQRCELVSGNHSSVLSLTVHRIHGTVNLAVIEDVTKLVEQEQKIFADEQRFRAIFDNVRDYAIFTIDPDGIIEQWNQSLERFGGWLAEDVVGRSISMFLAEEHRSAGRIEQLLAQARATGSVEAEGWCLRRDGSRAWTNTVLTVLPDPAGAVRGFVAVSRDMTERKRMEDDLRRLASTDPLTGALNRRSGQVVLAEAFGTDHGPGASVGILMIDIDHFKTINDQHGHVTGDMALCAVVDACREALAANTSIVRWGGEEFLVVLPSTDEPQIAQAAETLRKAIAEASVVTPGGALWLTASIGAALHAASPDALIRKADGALYAAKRAGRNCIRVVA